MLDRSIRLFQVFGIRVELHFTFILLPLYFGIEGARAAGGVGLLWSMAFLAAIFGSVVMHELGHSFAARKFGILTQRILLMPIGGMAQFERIPQNARQEILITIAGPAVNLALFALLLPFTGPFDLARMSEIPLSIGSLAFMLMAFNLIMLLFNLVPIFPMDGGRLLRASLSFWIGHYRATLVASRIGSWAAAFLAVYFLIGIDPPQMLPAALFLFILFANQAETRSAEVLRRLQGLKVSDLAYEPTERLSPSSPTEAALECLSRMPPRDLVVTKDGKPIGIVELKALRKLVRKGSTMMRDLPLSSIMNPRFATAQADDPATQVRRNDPKQVQTLLPVCQDEILVGVIDLGNLAEQAHWAHLARGSFSFAGRENHSIRTGSNCRLGEGDMENGKGMARGQSGVPGSGHG